jgi:hypothetical protein
MANKAKKSSARSKPKAAGNAAAKRVKRTAARSTVAAKRQASTATRATVASVKKSASVADDVMSLSTNAVKQLFSGAPVDASQFFAMSGMGGDSTAQLGKQAEVASRSMNEIFSLSKDNVEACVEAGGVAVSASKTLGAELFSYANKSFSQNVELSKELFGCRTLNDMFDLQSKLLKTNLDNFFSESVKVSELVFKAASSVSEPLNERVSITAQRISKTLTEAA